MKTMVRSIRSISAGAGAKQSISPAAGDPGASPGHHLIFLQ